jgi:hypothetical protein
MDFDDILGTGVLFWRRIGGLLHIYLHYVVMTVYYITAGIVVLFRKLVNQSQML